MIKKTNLEKALEENGEYRYVMAIKGTPEEIQSVLDRISAPLCAQLSTEDIVAHVRAVYDATAETYADHPEHQHVIDALLEFIELPHLRDGDNIIDLGCGPSVRDTFFLSCTNKDIRSALMGRTQDGVSTRERFAVPRIGFNVLAVDGSSRVVQFATWKLMTKKDEWRSTGIHFFRSGVALADIHDVSSTIDGTFHGVWSCASLLTHTPRALVHRALVSIASILESKGVLGVCYPSRNKGDYDNLRYSRTGRVKYFSRPEVSEIVSEAEVAGFQLIYESRADLERDGNIQKDFFTTQFFQKY